MIPIHVHCVYKHVRRACFLVFTKVIHNFHFITFFLAIICFVSLCLQVIVTNSFALFFVLSRPGDFKIAERSVLLICLGEATWVNHIPISLFPQTSYIKLGFALSCFWRGTASIFISHRQSKTPQIRKEKGNLEIFLLSCFWLKEFK